MIILPVEPRLLVTLRVAPLGAPKNGVGSADSKELIVVRSSEAPSEPEEWAIVQTSERTPGWNCNLTCEPTCCARALGEELSAAAHNRKEKLRLVLRPACLGMGFRWLSMALNLGEGFSSRVI